MWRRSRIVAMLLLLGAILNVAVAWSAMLLGRDESGSLQVYTVGDPPQELIQWVRRFGYESVDSIVAPSAAVERGDFDHTERPAWWSAEIAASPYHATWAGGWPMLSVTAWADRGRHDPARSVRGGVQWKVPPQGWPTWLRGQRFTQGPRMVFPLRPIWPGFLVNTLLYASVLGIVFEGLGFVRACSRTWRGRCRRCGYPRRESSVCSECGATVKPLAATAPPHSSPPSS